MGAKEGDGGNHPRASELLSPEQPGSCQVGGGGGEGEGQQREQPIGTAYR